MDDLAFFLEANRAHHIDEGAKAQERDVLPPDVVSIEGFVFENADGQGLFSRVRGGDAIEKEGRGFFSFRDENGGTSPFFLLEDLDLAELEQGAMFLVKGDLLFDFRFVNRVELA